MLDTAVWTLLAKQQAEGKAIRAGENKEEKGIHAGEKNKEEEKGLRAPGEEQ
jgi:hypothetical protein